ncbi:MAG TPA: SRPBCC family protein [Geminicoccaceae bacterium]|nr:SRPBCC family protein [Geminicoccus sp.]HMU53032.1 SRPBCC family protein [Geminicoccaceae bacterium]
MLDEFGTVTAPRTVRIARLLPGPIERVWAFLTESDKRGLWLASGPMELRVGGSVRLDFLHTSLAPDEEVPARYERLRDGVTQVGHVTRIEPPRLLSYTWNEKDGREPSEVTFNLTERGDRVLLEVTHERLPDRGDMVGVATGWHAHLGLLVDRLSGRQTQQFWSRFETLRGEYERRIPA